MLKVYIASPYIVALMTNNQIQVRNIFNPNCILQDHKLNPCSYHSACVAQNLAKMHEGRLDDFFVIFKSQEADQRTFGQPEVAGAPRIINHNNSGSETRIVYSVTKF